MEEVEMAFATGCGGHTNSCCHLAYITSESEIQTHSVVVSEKHQLEKYQFENTSSIPWFMVVLSNRCQSREKGGELQQLKGCLSLSSQIS